MNILIVDDAPKGGDCLNQGLADAGCAVDPVPDGIADLPAGLAGDDDLLPGAASAK